MNAMKLLRGGGYIIVYQYYNYLPSRNITGR